MAKPAESDLHPALKDVLGATRRVMASVFVFSMCINLLMLAVPVYMLQLFDRVVATQSADTLYSLSMMAVAAILSMALLEAVRGRLMMRLGGWTDRRLAVLLLDGSIVGAARGGDATAQALRDLGTVRTFLTGPGLFPAVDAIWVPVFLGIVYLLHPLLGIVSILGAVVLFGLALANDLGTRRATQQAGHAANRNLNAADAAVRNAGVIQALGMKAAVTRRWIERNREASALQELASARAGTIAAMAKFVRLGVQVSILGLGAYLAMVQEISPGSMIAGSIIMGRGLAPIEQSIQGWRGMVSARAAFSRLVRVLRDADRGEPVTPMPRPEGRLAVNQVTYVPPGAEHPVLKRVGFALEPGESLGLIGPTAAGKSTLAKILVGSLKPSLGTVTLDGLDIWSWDATDRGRFLGYLPQDIEMFDGTVRDNIARLGEAEDEAVFVAAHVAGVDDMIRALPKAYDTPLGTGGVILSGGQRQRLALARALFGDPVLIVLDEPNSNLDKRGEDELINALARLKETQATVVVIAQHPAVLQGVDKILVMKDGEVQHFGPRDEIMAAMGHGDAPAPAPGKTATGA